MVEFQVSWFDSDRQQIFDRPFGADENGARRFAKQLKAKRHCKEIKIESWWVSDSEGG